MNVPSDGNAAYEVRRAIVDRVTRDLESWFPGTPPGAPVHVRPFSSRRRSQLYAVSVGEPAAAPVIVAKVRTPHSATGGGAGRPCRPTLAPAAVDEEELTSREYAGLRLLQATFPDGDARFGADDPGPDPAVEPAPPRSIPPSRPDA